MKKNLATYYCTQRPPGPGAVPAQGLAAITEYSARRYMPAIDRMAWGMVTYDRELTFEEVERYELTREPRISE